MADVVRLSNALEDVGFAVVRAEKGFCAEDIEFRFGGGGSRRGRAFSVEIRCGRGWREIGREGGEGTFPEEVHDEIAERPALDVGEEGEGDRDARDVVRVRVVMSVFLAVRMIVWRLLGRLDEGG